MSKVKRILITSTMLVALIFGGYACTKREITVSFHSQGGEVIPSKKIAQGSKLNPVPTPTREGYEFSAWYVDPTLSTQFDPQASLIRNYDLYATWSIKSFTLTFIVGDGGMKGDPAKYGPKQVNFGTSLPLPDAPEAPDALLFDGWYKDEECTQRNNISSMPERDVVLYANYKQIDLYITFIFPSGSTERVGVAKGDPFPVDRIPAVPERDGKKGEWDLSSVDLTSVNDNLEIRTIYEDIKFEVTFKDSLGNTYPDLTQSISYGKGVIFPVIPIMESRVFQSFSFNPSGFIFEDFTSKVIGNLEIVFNYSPIIYTIVVHNGFGSNETTTPQQVYSGANVNLPTPATVPGYTFSSWSGITTNVRSRGDVTAVYTKNSYSIVFDATPGYFQSNTNAFKTITKPLGDPLGENPETPVLVGKYFLGWYDDAQFGQLVNVNSSTLMMINGSELYARYDTIPDDSVEVTIVRHFQKEELVNFQHKPTPTYVQDIESSNKTIYVAKGSTVNYSLVVDSFAEYVFNVIRESTTDYGDNYSKVNVQTAFTIDVTYRKKVQELKFEYILKSGVDEDLVKSPEYRYVLYGDSPEYAALNIEHTSAGVNASHYTANYTYVWSRSSFDSVQYDIAVGEHGFDNAIKSVLFYSFGSILYIARQESVKARLEGSGDEETMTNIVLFLASRTEYQNGTDQTNIYAINSGQTLAGFLLSKFPGDFALVSTFTGLNQFVDYVVSKYEDKIVTDSSSLMLLKRDGYYFKGWSVTPNDTLSYLTDSQITFSNLCNLSSQTTLYAIWLKIETFPKPVINTVNIGLESENEYVTIDFSFEKTPKSSPVDPVSVVFYIGSKSIEVPYNPNYINFDSGKNLYVFQIQHNLTGSSQEYLEIYNFMAPLLISGSYYVRVEIKGNNVQHGSSQPSNEYIYEKKEQIDIGNNAQVKDTYIFVPGDGLELGTYIFVTNQPYEFGVGDNIQLNDIVTPNKVSVDDPECVDNRKEGSNYIPNIIQTSHNTGTFTFNRVYADGQPSKKFNAIVVYDIDYFTYGDNYQQYIRSTSSSAILSKEYLNTGTIDLFTVGSDNDFYLDLNLKNRRGEALNIKSSDLKYELEVKAGGNFASEPMATYFTVGKNNAIRYNNQGTYEGKEFKISVSPFYQPLTLKVDPVVFTFKMEDAHNANTYLELRELFANMSVKKIAVLTSEKVVLPASCFNEGGYLINWEYNSALARISTNTNNDDITLIGNYQTLNGSGIPLLNENSTGSLGEPVSYNTSYAGQGKIFNTNINMIIHHVRDLSKDTVDYRIENGHGDVDVNLARMFNNNKMTIKNYSIVGNTAVPAVDYSKGSSDVEAEELTMAKSSGSTNGIYARSEFEGININVRNSYLAFYFQQTGFRKSVDDSAFNVDTDKIKGTLNYVRVDNTWANSIWATYASKIYIKNSEFGQSGNGSFGLNDQRFKSQLYYDTWYRGADYQTITNLQLANKLNPEIIIEENVVVNNYVSGSEFFFKVNGMTAIAAKIKSQVQGFLTTPSPAGIKELGRSIIKIVPDGITGLPTEKFNFIFMSLPSGDVYDNTNGRQSISEGIFTIKNPNAPYNYISVAPGYNFLDGDNRLKGGQLIWPVGSSWDDKSGTAGSAITAFTEPNSKYLSIILPDPFSGQGYLVAILGFYDTIAGTKTA